MKIRRHINKDNIENKYLIDLLNSQIDNEEKIVSNASSSCHKCKTFFVSFMIPFIATSIATFFSIYNKEDSDVNLFIYFVVLFFILLLLVIIELSIHGTFYSIQSKHRHVLSSLYLLKGNALRYNIKLNLKFDYEALKKFNKIVELRAEKITISLKGFIKDTLSYSLPFLVIILFCLSLTIFYGVKAF